MKNSEREEKRKETSRKMKEKEEEKKRQNKIREEKELHLYPPLPPYLTTFTSASTALPPPDKVRHITSPPEPQSTRPRYCHSLGRDIRDTRTSACCIFNTCLISADRWSERKSGGPSGTWQISKSGMSQFVLVLVFMFFTIVSLSFRWLCVDLLVS